MGKYEGQTGETHEVKLPSAVEQVQWAKLRAAPGGAVGLDIFTRFVGNGAKLQIKLTDHKGWTHGTFKNEIHNNHLSAEIQVPPKARDALYAEVKFPKHGLKQKSPALVLTPPVEVKNAQWSKDEARRGDVLTLSADVKGVPDGTKAQIRILEHDQDGAHDPITAFATLVSKNRVEAEWEYAYHEDTDDIPRDEELEKGYQPPEYFFVVEVEGVSAESGLLTFKDWVEFIFEDAEGSPREDIARVKFQYPDGTEVEKVPDTKGRIVLKDVPPGVITIVEQVRKKSN